MSWRARYPEKRDVIVCILCLAFLFGALGQVGEGGRRRAKEAVCQANLRQWHGIFRDYIEENDGRFLTGSKIYGYWWPLQLSHEYQDWKRNRAWFCPMATTPDVDEKGIHSTMWPAFRAWGIFSPGMKIVSGDKTYFMNPNGLAGSYGLNGYTLNITGKYRQQVSAGDGWADLQDVPDADRVPLFIDALRFDLWPLPTDAPAPDELVPWSTDYMTSCCINRHNGTVNCLFVDGSARKVGLKELWTLKWHRSFNTAGPWTKAGGVQPGNWPQWMSTFKDY